jgi:endonuclease III
MKNKSTRESLKIKKDRASKLLQILKEQYPNITIQLVHNNPFELLIATILSAQCTDARVNIVTTNLFQKYQKPLDYLNVSQEELEIDIFSTGFYKAKAKNIRFCCQRIISEFDGKVPDNMSDLLSLGGVGRKTANVVLSHAFGIPGIVVDTHVKRISNRLDLTKETDSIKIEFSLMKIIEKNIWVDFTHYFIMLGREICTSRKAKCEICSLTQHCPSAFKVQIKKKKENLNK